MTSYNTSSLQGKCILLATILASGMAFLDGTVVNIAIPVIQYKLHATLSQIQWVVNSYTLMLAALILISGSLGDRFGRKRIFLIGIGFFTVSSFLCSISHNITQLIFFRTLQGIGAAMMIPGSLSIIDRSFEEKIRGKVIGLWSGFAGGIAALGPFLGGWLVQTFGWPSIFYINIPIGIIAFFITLRFVPETKNTDAKSLDLFGSLLMLVGLFGISYGLIQGSSIGWNTPVITGSLVGGCIALIAFVYTEMKVKEPIFPIHILTSPLVAGANIVTLFLYFALNGVIFFLVLNLQQVQHYSPLYAGMSMLPSILLITFLSGPAGSLADRIGPRVPMIVGPLLVSAGMVLFTIPGTHAHYFTQYFPGLVLFGLGMSLVIAPLTKSALAVNPKYSGAASGVNNAISRIAALFGIALLGAILVSMFASNLQERLHASNLPQKQQQEVLQQNNKLLNITLPEKSTFLQKQEMRSAIDTAFIYGFRWIMGINALLAFFSAVIASITIHNPKQKQ